MINKISLKDIEQYKREHEVGNIEALAALQKEQLLAAVAYVGDDDELELRYILKCLINRAYS